MSKNEDKNTNINNKTSSKKKNTNKLNLNDFELKKEENSKQDNSYSISGQNINKKYDINNSDFLDDSLNSEFENEINSFRNSTKPKGLNLSNASFKKRTYRNSVVNINNNILRSETNTMGDLIPKTNNKTTKSNKRIKKRKTIKKMQTIESFSHLEEEDNQLTIRQRLTQFFELNNRLFYIKMIVSILNSLSYIYYLICTYKPTLFKSLNYVDYIVCSLVIIEHIINILLAHHILSYLISIESLINFFIEIPPFFSFMCEDYHLNILYRFINITRVTRLMKSYILMDIIQAGEKSVKSQILNIIFSILLIILIFAGVVQMLDFENVDEQMKIEFGPGRHNLLLRRYFHHYFYFIIVSLTTVGYGEIIPLSILSQMMIIFLVIVILVIIPDQTNDLINLSNAQTIYESKEYISSQDVPFVVLIGNIGLDALKSFCEEYFHPDHGKFYRHIVILVNKFPNKPFESFLNEKDNNKFIYYLQGDPMKNSDLLRADILKAKSCIIFSNKNTRDPFSEDQRALLLSIFVKKFYYLTSLENLTNANNKEVDIIEKPKINLKTLLKNNNFKIYLQLNKSESYQYFYSALQKIYKKNMAKDQLLIIETLKMNLLSKSCLTPGIISLLSNLIISTSSEKMVKNQPEWLREYSEGTEYEIYRFTAEGQLLNFTYPQLAIEIYNKFHSILIALEINFRGNNIIKLNPQSTEKISDIIDKGLIMKSKRMKTGEGGQLYSLSSSEDDNNNSIIEEENKKDQFIKLMKLRKQIKVNFYLISKDKEIIEEILKMDVIKSNDILKEKRRKTMLKINMLSSMYNISEEKGITSTARNLNSNNNQPEIRRSLRKNSKRHVLLEDEKGYSDLSSLSEEDMDSKGYLLDLGNNGNKFNEEEQIKNNYYTLESFDKNYLNTNEIMRQGIKDRNDIQHHVIICGMHPEIIHFILPLRAKYLTENMLKWVVILAPMLPQEIYDALSIFPKIIFIQGDPLHPENLFRANITTADIAVILSSNFSKNTTNNETIGINNQEANKDEDSDLNDSSSDSGKNKLDEEILDSTTLFIYKTIRKINHSIKIITELLVTKNIEFLLTAKYLKKLYDQAKKESYNSQNNQNEKEKEININPNYEMTPVFASGEIYLPSLVDKIIAQLFFNSNLLDILKLLLEGEKTTMKKKEKKLNDLFNLTGSNLFMIPCEIKSESFGEMFKRMLSKNGILCIALYRKNAIDNFYYVYTNPRMTTLIRETDFVFVLSGTENIESLNDKNIFDVSLKKEEEDGYNNNEINIEENNNEAGKPSIFQVLQESIQKQFNNIKGVDNNIGNNINNNNNINNIINNNINNTTINNDIEDINIDNNIDTGDKDKEITKINNRINEIRKSIVFRKYKEDENNQEDKKNYSEVEKLQYKVDKTMEKLKKVSQKVEEFEREIKAYIKDEINNEFFVYLNKIKSK